jgi:pimeloyl-ACP methyl ester carboxylesterase
MTITLNVLDGLIVAREVMGEGQPVLLLHGWGGRIESMQRVAERLAPLGYQVHNIDLPGFGRSAIPPETWGIADYARLATHYLDQAGLKPVSLIGHSFGGRIAIVLGADHPAYVGKMVLADSAGVLTPPTTAQRTRQALFRAANAMLSLPGLGAFQTRLRQWGRNRFGSEDLRTAGPLEPIFRRVIREDLLPFAATIKAPTLLIWGDQDQDTRLWQGQVLEKTIPDAGLVVFRGAGHFAYQERLADFVRIVDTFLKDKR